MKKAFIILVFLSISLVSFAQRDSIRVVIECDSLYRPFLDYDGEVHVMFNSDFTYDSMDYRFSLAKMKSFKIQKPEYDSAMITLQIGTSNFPYQYLSNIFLDVTSNSYMQKRYNYQYGKWYHSDTINYKNNTFTVKFPSNLEYEKFLIDNTCPSCSRNDSVSWITYGLLVEDPRSGEINLPKVFNPYNNPILDEIYNPGCSPSPQHWYCHRCKKEY